MIAREKCWVELQCCRVGMVQKAELAFTRERAAVEMLENDARVAKAALRSGIDRARSRRRKGSRQQRDMRERLVARFKAER